MIRFAFYEKHHDKSLEDSWRDKRLEPGKQIRRRLFQQSRVKDDLNEENSSGDGEKWTDSRDSHQENRLGLVITYLDVCGKGEKENIRIDLQMAGLSPWDAVRSYAEGMVWQGASCVIW